MMNSDTPVDRAMFHLSPVEKSRNGVSWFNKGTLERFVRFVGTPDVLESANTYDAKMSQLEGARIIYSQGAEDLLSGTLGKMDTNTKAAADITKKELQRAIDVWFVTLKQDLATACAQAFSAGFSIDNVSKLLLCAEYFGANHLKQNLKIGQHDEKDTEIAYHNPDNLYLFNFNEESWQ